jgi:hypothetical protein
VGALLPGATGDARRRHDHPAIHYNLACLESLAGNRDRALQELAKSAPRHRAQAREDPDFAGLLDDPEFQALTTGS